MRFFHFALRAQILFGFLLLAGFGFSVASSQAPRRGYLTKGSRVLVCNCQVKPPVSECGDPPTNACGSRRSCETLCKETECADIACIASSAGGAEMHCNDKEVALNFLRVKAKENGKRIKYWKAHLSKCGF